MKKQTISPSNDQEPANMLQEHIPSAPEELPFPIVGIGASAGGLEALEQFLRHVERCRILLHLVDVSEMSGRKPGDDFKIILSELEHLLKYRSGYLEMHCIAMTANPTLLLRSNQLLLCFLNKG